MNGSRTRPAGPLAGGAGAGAKAGEGAAGGGGGATMPAARRSPHEPQKLWPAFVGAPQRGQNDIARRIVRGRA